MLNFRLLHVLISSHSLRTYLGVTATLGLGVLIDLVLFLKLSSLLGPWIVMALLSIIVAIGIFVMFRSLNILRQRLIQTIESGKFIPMMFSRYLSTLAATFLLIIPGLLNSAAGLILLIPNMGEKFGSIIARLTGIDWQESYEFLRLEHMARNQLDDFA